jgi:hypothetical protein
MLCSRAFFIDLPEKPEAYSCHNISLSNQRVQGELMKSILLSFASLLVTVSAFAMPAVGDSAVYNTTITQNGQSFTGLLEQSITSMDSASGKFNVQTVMDFNGQKQSQSDLRDAQELISDQMASDIVANCANYGGQSDSVTVPAGSFHACAITTNENGATGKVWIAAGVAFGVVKADQEQNGMTTHAELASFKNGN